MRLTFLSNSSALADLEDERSVQILCSELPRGSGGALAAVPYSSYAEERYAIYSSEKPTAAAAAALARVRPGGREAGDGEDQRAAKRRRVLGRGEAEDGGVETMDVGEDGDGEGRAAAASSRMCVIM